MIVRGLERPRFPVRFFRQLEFLLVLPQVLAIGFLILFRDALQTYDPVRGDLEDRFKPVGTAGHWLGTDNLGRDLWSRTLEGLSWSVSAALTATLIAIVIGTLLGLAAARWSGWPRAIVNNVVNTTLAFPSLVIAMVVVAIVGRGFWPLTLTLGILTWPVFARVVFAEASSLLQRGYVVMADFLGTQPWLALIQHVLPALRPTLTVMFVFHFADMLIAESALSFLGLGAPLGVPTWGNMLQESRDFLMVAPWLMAVPASVMVLVVLSANLLGDAISRWTGRAEEG
jgi:peptide/nickel transport system permease protein